jgi:hypothetical protein
LRVQNRRFEGAWPPQPRCRDIPREAWAWSAVLPQGLGSRLLSSTDLPFAASEHSPWLTRWRGFRILTLAMAQAVVQLLERGTTCFRQSIDFHVRLTGAASSPVHAAWCGPAHFAPAVALVEPMPEAELRGRRFKSPSRPATRSRAEAAFEPPRVRRGAPRAIPFTEIVVPCTSLTHTLRAKRQFRPGTSYAVGCVDNRRWVRQTPNPGCRGRSCVSTRKRSSSWRRR